MEDCKLFFSCLIIHSWLSHTLIKEIWHWLNCQSPPSSPQVLTKTSLLSSPLPSVCLSAICSFNNSKRCCRKAAAVCTQSFETYPSEDGCHRIMSVFGCKDWMFTRFWLLKLQTLIKQSGYRNHHSKQAVEIAKDFFVLLERHTHRGQEESESSGILLILIWHSEFFLSRKICAILCITANLTRSPETTLFWSLVSLGYSFLAFSRMSWKLLDGQQQLFV